MWPMGLDGLATQGTADTGTTLCVVLARSLAAPPYLTSGARGDENWLRRPPECVSLPGDPSCRDSPSLGFHDGRRR